MKRLMKIAMLLLGMSMLFSSCSDDVFGTNTALIGTWDNIECYHLFNDGTKEIIEPSGYLVFTDTKMTIYDENDVMDGIPTKYTYSDGMINVMGMDIWQVLYISKGLLKRYCFKKCVCGEIKRKSTDFFRFVKGNNNKYKRIVDLWISQRNNFPRYYASMRKEKMVSRT